MLTGQQEPVALNLAHRVEKKELLAHNWLLPRHLLTQTIPKIAKIWKNNVPTMPKYYETVNNMEQKRPRDAKRL